MSTLKNYLALLRLNKPIPLFLLLWPTLWALWLAGQGKPATSIVMLFIVGVILMRSAGCVINDIADRKLDKHVARTKDRPLTAGKIRTRSALILFGVIIFCAFLLVLQFNHLTVVLAFVGAGLTIVYPFMKRFTHLPQLGLGLAFAWGVPMAFAAVEDAVPFSGWLVFFAAAIWPVIYDTMYAMVDRADDVKVGIKSTAILFGNQTKIILAILQFIFIALMIWVGITFQLGSLYYFGLALAMILFGYQLWLIKDNDRAKCLKAFLNNHWIGLIIFLGIGLSIPM